MTVRSKRLGAIDNSGGLILNWHALFTVPSGATAIVKHLQIYNGGALSASLYAGQGPTLATISGSRRISIAAGAAQVITDQFEVVPQGVSWWYYIDRTAVNMVVSGALLLGVNPL